MIRALAISALLVVTAHAGVDVDRFVDALRERETGNRPVRDGAAGERGPWQITGRVWSLQMPGKPFAQARQYGPARACAVKHVRWLAAQLQARGVHASAFNLALAWNAGLEGATRGRAPERAYEYARAVEALYNGAIGQKTLNSPAEFSSRRSVSVEQMCASAFAMKSLYHAENLPVLRVPRITPGR
jgi:hypothetical protein